VERVHSSYTDIPGPSWFLHHTKNTAVFQVGVNKIPPKFNTLFAASLEVIRLFKGLTA
jgi:hypothetical protein